MAEIFNVNLYSKKGDKTDGLRPSAQLFPSSSNTEAKKSMASDVNHRYNSVTGGTPCNSNARAITTNPIPNWGRLTFPEARTPRMIETIKTISASDMLIKKPKKNPEIPSGSHAESDLLASSRKSSPILRVSPARQYAQSTTNTSNIRIRLLSV